MTISYNIDIARSNLNGILRLLFRWRGSVWQAVLGPLICWTCAYYVVFGIYHLFLPQTYQASFEKVTNAFEEKIDSYIPLTFVLGFFVSSVVSRWMTFLNSIGWIDTAAIAISMYIRGSDDETRIIRRSMIRYMVLSQTLVLRDVSIQVRGRFPTLGTIEAAGLLTDEERDIIEKTIDAYSRYWIPIQWTEDLLIQAQENNKISNTFTLEKISNEINNFRQGLESLLKFDWVPIPLVYPQLVTFSVRLYFFITLFTRQYTKPLSSEFPASLILCLPLATMIQFIVYIGWLKVAEEILNPLGNDEDDLECNYIIDKNLITGFTLVDNGGKITPKPRKDAFWDVKKIALLYSFEAAKRPVTPLACSFININFVKNVDNVIMVPHKCNLADMTKKEREENMKKVSVAEFNKEYLEAQQNQKKCDPNKILEEMKKICDDNVFVMDNVLSQTPLL